MAQPSGSITVNFLLLLSSFASTMPPPQCPGPCGVTKRTELESAALRKKWAAQEGLSWSWLSFPNRPRACAYWHLCRQCHQKAFPLDNRTRNRHSRPWEMVWDSRVLDRHRGLSRLTVGDFYLTAAPPEYLEGFFSRPSTGPSTRARSRFRPPPGAFRCYAC